MPEPVICDICRCCIELHASYVVRIAVFADPSMPPLDSDAAGCGEYETAMQDLLEQMNSMTSDDLQDDVHRQFEYRVCRPCQRILLANPLGKPRQTCVGKN